MPHRSFVRSKDTRMHAVFLRSLEFIAVGLIAYAQNALAFDTAESALATAGAAAQPRLVAKYDRLPLRFEQNLGQLDASVQYVSRGLDRTLFLTRDEAVISLHGDAATSESVVRMTFKDNAGRMTAVGEGPVETTSRYYIGNDPRHWQPDVPNFSRVRYRNMYPGIDVAYHGNARQLEYDFIVAPGANPLDIDLAFDGVDSIDIDPAGDLVLHTAGGELRQKRPVAFQTIDGKRHIVNSHYVRRGWRDIGIALAPYDHRRTLVVDPVSVFYSTYLGGSGSDKVLAIAADSAGNTWVTGLTQSIDFPVTNAIAPLKHGASDVFVAKINATGTALVYSTYLGGANIDAALGIARDAAGNAYVTGYSASPDFPVTANVRQPALNGSAYDAFVAKLGANGSLVYSTFLGGTNVDMANAIAVDASGNAYVTGFTCSSDFPTANPFQSQLAGAPTGCFAAQDAFVFKLTADATALVYSTFFGGGAKDEAKAIAVDTQGRASITGSTSSNDFPTAGVQVSGYQGQSDVFVSRFTASGGLDYSTYFAGTDQDEGLGIATDSAGAFYVTGMTRSIDFPTVNAFQTNLHGIQDAFVFKLLVQTGLRGSATIAYSSYLGGRYDDTGHAIAIDSGYAYLTGETRSLDFPLHSPTQPMMKGPSDAFVSRIASTGALAYSTFLGGNDEDAGWGIALSNGSFRGNPDIHIGGLTYSSDIATGGVVQPIPPGGPDGFVIDLKYGP
jgi:hypothetical protein